MREGEGREEARSEEAVRGEETGDRRWRLKVWFERRPNLLLMRPKVTDQMPSRQAPPIHLAKRRSPPHSPTTHLAMQLSSCERSAMPLSKSWVSFCWVSALLLPMCHRMSMSAVNALSSAPENPPGAKGRHDASV